MSSDFSNSNFNYYNNGNFSGFPNNYNWNNFYQPVQPYDNNINYNNLVYQHERTEEYLIQKLQAMFKIANYREMYTLIESFSFSSKYHPYLQELWYNAHYQEAEISRRKSLSPVAKYRIRQKYPLPKTIWDGEKTTYCFKESARKLLKKAFEKNPFPSGSVKASLAQQTELSVDQISNWFKNCRQRHKTIRKKPSKTNELENFESVNANSIQKTEEFQTENISMISPNDINCFNNQNSQREINQIPENNYYGNNISLISPSGINYLNNQNSQGEINQIPENNYYGSLPYNYPLNLQYLSYLDYLRNCKNRLENSFSLYNPNY